MFRRNRLLQAMITWRAAVWVVTAIQLRSRQDWFSQHLVVFFYGVPIVFTYRRLIFSKSLLRPVHCLPDLASERRAQFVCADAQRVSAEGSVSAVAQWRRPACALFLWLFLAYPFGELLIRATGVERGRSYLLAVAVALGFSEFYEVVEGIVAGIVALNLGKRWLGTEGGPWDAQKDTARALIAAVIAMRVMRWRASRYRQQATSLWCA